MSTREERIGDEVTYALRARCPRRFFRSPPSASFASLSLHSLSESPRTKPTESDGRKTDSPGREVSGRAFFWAEGTGFGRTGRSSSAESISLSNTSSPSTLPRSADSSSLSSSSDPRTVPDSQPSSSTAGSPGVCTSSSSSDASSTPSFSSEASVTSAIVAAFLFAEFSRPTASRKSPRIRNTSEARTLELKTRACTLPRCVEGGAGETTGPEH
jgi:hypothetical protein